MIIIWPCHAARTSVSFLKRLSGHCKVDGQGEFDEARHPKPLLGDSLEGKVGRDSGCTGHTYTCGRLMLMWAKATTAL